MTLKYCFLTFSVDFIEDICAEMQFGKISIKRKSKSYYMPKDFFKYHCSIKLYVLHLENAWFIFENRMYNTCLKGIFIFFNEMESDDGLSAVIDQRDVKTWLSNQHWFAVYFFPLRIAVRVYWFYFWLFSCSVNT